MMRLVAIGLSLLLPTIAMAKRPKKSKVHAKTQTHAATPVAERSTAPVAQAEDDEKPGSRSVKK